MPNHEDSSRHAARLAGLFTFTFVILCIWTLAELCWRPLKRVAFAGAGQGDLAEAAAGLGDALVGALPVFSLLAALWTARGLFRTFSSGAVLEEANGRALTRIGDLLVASAVATIVLSPFILDVIHRTPFNVSFDIDAVVLGCVGLAIRFLGPVFVSAARIKSEHDQFI